MSGVRSSCSSTKQLYFLSSHRCCSKCFVVNVTVHLTGVRGSALRQTPTPNVNAQTEEREGLHKRSENSEAGFCINVTLNVNTAECKRSRCCLLTGFCYFILFLFGFFFFFVKHQLCYHIPNRRRTKVLLGCLCVTSRRFRSALVVCLRRRRNVCVCFCLGRRA